MELIKIWQVLLRRRWVVIGIFVVFCVTAFFGMMLIPKTYEANAKILIDVSYPLSHLESAIGLKSASAESDDYEYETEVALAQVKPLLQALIEKLKLKDRDGELMKAVDIVKSNPLIKLLPRPFLEIEQYEDSDIIEITANSNSKEEAATMANQLAELYIRQETMRTQKEYHTAKVFVEKEIERVKQAYYGDLEKIKIYLVDQGIADISSETETLIDKVSSLTDSYEENEKTLIGLEKSLVVTQNKMEEQGQFRKEYSEYAYNDQIKSFRYKIGEYLVNLAGKSVDIRSSHPDYLQIEKELQAARDVLKKEADLILDSERFSIDPIYENLAQQLVDQYIDREVGLVRGKIIKKYLNAYQEELLQMPERKVEHGKLEADLSIHKEMYQELLSYLLQVSIAESVNLSKIRIVEPATIPEKADFPKKVWTLAIAIFLGSFWALFCGFLVDYIDLNVKTPDSLKTIKTAPFLATIPYSKELKMDKTILHVKSGDRTRSAYRALCNALHLNSDGHPLQTLLITSSYHNEGKSSIATNLAIMFSEKGDQTLLVNLTDHDGGLAQRLGVTSPKGIEDILATAEFSKDEAIPTEISHLSLIGNGQLSSSFMTGKNMDKLKQYFNEIKGRYQKIIIDTIPVSPTRDIINWVDLTDGVLYVVAPRKVSLEKINENIQIFLKMDIKWIGMVANRFG